ncbi:uncharacterized protein LOC141909821 [Tubulanus polymorphus]|uniref:uncharacterized protein LOC141909821 n=1 Tax=Tubulanus polymorphus TaxID=672921 RepID=UPI003DA1E9C4
MDIVLFIVGFIIILIAENYAKEYTNRPDNSFPSTNLVANHHVTCGDHLPGMFPSKTWTCNDFKVEGKRLSYGYLPGFGATDRNCEEDNGRNDIAAICRHLLQNLGITDPLWGAFVSNMSCEKSPEERLIFRNTSKYHQWMQEDAGHGYVLTLQCMIAPST